MNRVRFISVANLPKVTQRDENLVQNQPAGGWLFLVTTLWVVTVCEHHNPWNVPAGVPTQSIGTSLND